MEILFSSDEHGWERCKVSREHEEENPEDHRGTQEDDRNSGRYQRKRLGDPVSHVVGTKPDQAEPEPADEGRYDDRGIEKQVKVVEERVEQGKHQGIQGQRDKKTGRDGAVPESLEQDEDRHQDRKEDSDSLQEAEERQGFIVCPDEQEEEPRNQERLEEDHRYDDHLEFSKRELR